MDRKEEPETNISDIEINESKDTNERRIKKENKTHYGYKGFISDTKFDKQPVSAQANESEMKVFKLFAKDNPSFEIFADIGYTSAKDNTLQCWLLIIDCAVSYSYL